MLRLIQENDDIIEQMCGNILTAHKAGIYNGAYRAVEIAVKGRKK